MEADNRKKEIAPSNILEKYLDTNTYTASELINTNFEKLSNYEKKLIIKKSNESVKLNHYSFTYTAKFLSSQ